jgi:N utilization substance protein B
MNTTSGKSARRGTRARTIARKVAMQALYQWQLNHTPVQDIINQFLGSDDAAGVDREYFTELLMGCTQGREQIDAAITPFVDRPLDQLDPVETAILMIGMFELLNRADVPYRVVINEAVDLCKRFGATDAHKYVNAVLDRAARDIRKAEQA